MISQKIRTNATIAYFFLGWIFLLARNNPDFQDPFIRQHAKIATRGHLVFLFGYAFYSHFVSRFFMHTIPLLGITIDRVIDLSVFCTLTLFILLGAYRASRGDEAKITASVSERQTDPTTMTYEGATERDRMIFFLSYIPFVGVAVADRYPSAITDRGSDTGTLFALAYLAYFSYRGFDSVAMAFLFLYVLLIVWLAGQFFFRDECALPWFLISRLSLDRIWQIVRVGPSYLSDIVAVIFGQRESLRVRDNLSRTEEGDRTFRSTMADHFTDTSLALPDWLIFVPIVNIIYLPKLLVTRRTRYVLAIGQWLTITIVTTILFFLDVSSQTQTILLFPILLGMAHVSHDPLYRIPVVYELYALVNTLSFWLLENTRKIRDTKEKEQSVSFKVQ